MDAPHNTRTTATAIALAIQSAFIGGAASAPIIANAAPPPLILANDYDDAGVELSRYWMSEKYDGMRAYWNGARLLTRSGNLIHTPEWFTRSWPSIPLDGELWAGRGQFEQVTATVRDLEPDDADWRKIQFMVFDLPAHVGTFNDRLTALRALLPSPGIDTIRFVPQSRVSDEDELHRKLEAIAAAGGEGVMLHREDSLYRAERSDDLLKLKPHRDADAQVIAHLPGQGKYTGMLGALLVRTADGTQFRIGTGFTDEHRRHPPPIGSWVTYSYHNLTARGIPRFASFLRQRPE